MFYFLVDTFEKNIQLNIWLTIQRRYTHAYTYTHIHAYTHSLRYIN